MKEAIASLNIELNTNCPECNHYFDLVEDTDLNDEGWLLDQVLPHDETWIHAHKDFACKATCPECKTKFKVKGVDW